MAKSDEEPNRAAMPQCRERQSYGLSLNLRGTDTLPDSFILGQYRIILSADTASEVRQMLSQKRR